LYEEIVMARRSSEPELKKWMRWALAFALLLGGVSTLAGADEGQSVESCGEGVPTLLVLDPATDRAIVRGADRSVRVVRSGESLGESGLEVVQISDTRLVLARTETPGREIWLELPTEPGGRPRVRCLGPAEERREKRVPQVLDVESDLVTTGEGEGEGRLVKIDQNGKVIEGKPEGSGVQR
jgi:hypothetical protein